MRLSPLHCLVITTLAGAAACVPIAPITPAPRYLVALTSVERPQQAKDRYGPQTLSTVQDSGVTKYSFEDSLVSVVILPLEKEFDFVMTNKTDHTIKLVWDDAAFVNIDGESGRVIHSGIKLIDKEKPQPPSIIVRGGKLADIAVPSAHIAWVYNDWFTGPLIPRNADVSGKQIQLLLPIEIEGVENDYLFTFSVNPPAAVAPPTAAGSTGPGA